MEGTPFSVVAETPDQLSLIEAVERSSAAGRRGDGAAPRVLRGEPEAVWRAVSAVLRRTARREYLGFDDPPPAGAALPDEVREQAHRTMRTLVENGAAVRQIATAPGLGRQADEAPCVLWRDGGQARTVERLPFKACVVDRRVALIALDLGVFAHGVAVVCDPVLVGLVARVHDQLWGDGDDPRAAGGEEPPPHLLPVLEGLASGLPDERAAVRVGLTPRTYSRRVAELMALLGATSRFDAGTLAARRGWR